MKPARDTEARPPESQARTDEHGPDEHALKVGDGDGDGEAFPRHATADLVATALDAERRRALWQSWICAGGIIALALGLPTESSIGHARELVRATAEHRFSGPHVVPALLARGLVSNFGLRPEPAWFLVSAVCFGLCAPVLLSTARALGWTAPRALHATLLVLASPMAVLAGTLPGASAVGLLGAAILFHALVTGSDRARSLYAWRASAAFVIACTLNVINVLLWPALMWAVARKRPAKERDGHLAFALLAPLIAVCLATAAILGNAYLDNGSREVARVLQLSERTLLAGASGGPGPLLAWWTAWIPALMSGAVGIAALAFLQVRAERESRVGWLAAWCLIPWIVQSLGGTIDDDLPYLWLVPPALLGWLELHEILARREAERFIWLSSIALLGLGFGAVVFLRGLDREAEWRERASLVVDKGDLVLTTSPDHRYLLEQRFALEVVDLTEIEALLVEDRAGGWSRLEARIDALRQVGRRTVLDTAVTGSASPLSPDVKARLQRLCETGRVLDLDAASTTAAR